MHRLDQLAGFFEGISGYLSSRMVLLGILACGLLPIPIFLDVAGRFLLGYSLDGVIEVEGFLLTAFVFCTLAFLQSQKNTIKVDLFVQHLKPRPARALALFHWLLSFAVYGVIAWQLCFLALRKYVQGEFSYAFEIKVWYFVALSCLGVALLALTLLGDILRKVYQVLQDKNIGGFLLAVGGALLILSLPWLLKDTFLVQNRLLLGVCAMSLLLCLLFSGMPIGFVMALVGVQGIILLQPKLVPALNMVSLGFYSTANNYTLTVIPLFMLMGELAYQTGLSRDLFSTATVLFGRAPGGLATASITGCGAFAAVCGESMATAITMSSVALPEMRKHKYDPGFACATLAAGGTLGILIPPSSGFIFYAIITEESIGRLFMAGILPGLLLATLFILVIQLYAWRRPHMLPRGQATTLKAKFFALKGIIGMVLLIILILGGILSGTFSPNEGGAIGCAGALLYALVRGGITWRMVYEAVRATTLNTGKLMFILTGVTALGYFLAATKLPYELADAIVNLGANRYVILFFIILLYIVLGSVMNIFPMILLTLPSLFPSVVALGFDPIWFGVLIVILMEMGMITPPIGVNVFAISGMVKDVPMSAIFKNILPFFCMMCLCILLLILFPDIALYLPRTFM